MMKRILVIAVVGMVSGCVSGVKQPDSYTSAGGKTTIIESNAEMCRRSCNNDFSRCMDTVPAQTSGGLTDVPTGMFGASADCKNSLRSCLVACR
jgi:hypothetical protein